MRICVIYDCLFPYTVGGAERWYRNVAERLAQEGHDVTYLTLRQWDRGERLDLDARIRVVTAGPRMALYTSSGRRRILPPLVFGAGVLWHLLREGRRYEVVHTCAFPYFALLAAGAARRRGRYQVFSDWFEVWSESYWRDYLGGLGGRIGALVQRLCARVPQQAHCFSELHAKRLRAEGLPGPVKVLRGLYAEPTALPVASEADPVVLFAGRLIPEKQAPLGVAAIALAARRIAWPEGEVPRHGPPRHAVADAIVASGLQDRIHARGFTDAQTLDREMRRALCVLLPSRREGYGMVVVEDSARGTPSVVVAGEDNAAAELIAEGGNGVVVPSADPEAIAEAIVKVGGAGIAMRESRAAGYIENRERLSLESALP